MKSSTVPMIKKTQISVWGFVSIWSTLKNWDFSGVKMPVRSRHWGSYRRRIKREKSKVFKQFRENPLSVHSVTTFTARLRPNWVQETVDSAASKLYTGPQPAQAQTRTRPPIGGPRGGIETREDPSDPPTLKITASDFDGFGLPIIEQPKYEPPFNIESMVGPVEDIRPNSVEAFVSKNGKEWTKVYDSKDESKNEDHSVEIETYGETVTETRRFIGKKHPLIITDGDLDPERETIKWLLDHNP